ncbi:MAG: type II secretion system protein [Azonexus sp.]|nr:type II secretion system protein [Azonexus sp.]
MRRYYEFAVVVVLISILALVLMYALGRAQDAMEEARVQSEAAAIRIGLIEVVAHREVFGGELPKSANPVDWVSARPANYVGELDSRPASKSVWYFDRQARELVYLFRDGHRARFRISRDASVDSARAVVAGVGLLRLEDKQE